MNTCEECDRTYTSELEAAECRDRDLAEKEAREQGRFY